jgi:endonuclease/exonuclease/phosphatase family metal-dependent hydrolase
VRVLSYNIHKGIGGRDRQYRFQRIIDVIEHENPDLICLQEVDRNVRRSRYEDQPHLLADYFQAAARMYRINVHHQQGGYGNLLLSRWPLVSKHEISIRFNSRKPRSAQIAVVETPEGRLRLVNWHLGLAEKERHWQVRHLLEHQLFNESKGLPTVIIGDTNDWRNTLAGGPMAEYGYHQITGPPSRFRSFPAYMTLGALDKAYALGDVQIHEARVVRTPLSRVASDHLPLAVDFHLNGHGPHSSGKST